MDDASDRVAARAGNRLRDHACPHVNLNDARCGSRFSLGRLEQAFSVCFGSYRGCPMYHRINGEVAQPPSMHLTRRESAGPAAPLPQVTITAHGRSISLRPTGT